MNETELIDLILERLGSAGRDARLSVGPGDDAAVVSWVADRELVVSTDVCLDGVHVPGDCPGDLMGYRSVAMSVSDVIAMGANPEYLTLALTIERADVEWVKDFVEGVRVGCEKANTTVIGGNLAKGTKHIAMTAIGSVPAGQSVRRDTSQPDDDIWITGVLGASTLALQLMDAWVPRPLKELQHKTREDVVARYLLPPIRSNFVDCLRECASACTDISDGLAVELEQLVSGSSYGYRIETDDLPLWNGSEIVTVLTRDDSYEMLFTAPRKKRDVVLENARHTETPISRIGIIHATAERVFNPEISVDFPLKGYSHY